MTRPLLLFVLLSKTYARQRRALIDAQRASHELRPGAVEGVERPVGGSRTGGADHEWDTSSIAVVDKERNAVPESVRQALTQRGHIVKTHGPSSLGYNAGIMLDPVSGVLTAGADPRCEAYALAW